MWYKGMGACRKKLQKPRTVAAIPNIYTNSYSDGSYICEVLYCIHGPHENNLPRESHAHCAVGIILAYGAGFKQFRYSQLNLEPGPASRVIGAESAVGLKRSEEVDQRPRDPKAQSMLVVVETYLLVGAGMNSYVCTTPRSLYLVCPQEVAAARPV